MKKYFIVISYIMIFIFYMGIYQIYAFSKTEEFIEELIKAAEYGNFEEIKRLISKGANVNATKDGFTALSVATFCGHGDIAKYLIANGAEVNFVSKYYRTALMDAAGYGDLNLVKLLLTKGADAKFQGTGLTVLMVAAYNGNSEIVKLLIENGADVNIKNIEDGTIALFYAIQRGHLDVAKILLNENPFSVSEIDNEGKNILDYAFMSNDSNMIDFVKKMKK